jgi:hypothetical protein
MRKTHIGHTKMPANDAGILSLGIISVMAGVVPGDGT